MRPRSVPPTRSARQCDKRRRWSRRLTHVVLPARGPQLGLGTHISRIEHPSFPCTQAAKLAAKKAAEVEEEGEEEEGEGEEGEGEERVFQGEVADSERRFAKNVETVVECWSRWEPQDAVSALIKRSIDKVRVEE